MKVLVACEFSGIVREAFTSAGHYAVSCDLLPTEIEGNHYQGDVMDIINEDWDLMIAHPPCTYLAVSGARWWAGRQQEQNDAIEFVRQLMSAPIKRIAIENPIGKLSTAIRKPDQIIQPWQFGEDASKKTCLWLKNLPLLMPTKIIIKKRYANQTPSGQNNLAPSLNRAKIRSITYSGIAVAMAEQWGKND